MTASKAVLTSPRDTSARPIDPSTHKNPAHLEGRVHHLPLAKWPREPFGSGGDSRMMATEWLDGYLPLTVTVLRPPAPPPPLLGQLPCPTAGAPTVGPSVFLMRTPKTAAAALWRGDSGCLRPQACTGGGTWLSVRAGTGKAPLRNFNGSSASTTWGIYESYEMDSNWVFWLLNSDKN